MKQNEDLQICGFCGKVLKGIMYHGKDNDTYCGGKHEKLCDNRNNIFNEQLKKKLIR